MIVGSVRYTGYRRAPAVTNTYVISGTLKVSWKKWRGFTDATLDSAVARGFNSIMPQPARWGSAGSGDRRPMRIYLAVRLAMK
jgi:hypothetical protein